MPATARLVGGATTDGVTVRASFAIDGEGPGGAAIEYQASTPRKAADGTNKTLAQIQSDLITSVQTQRRAQRPAAPASVAISATVTIPD